MTFISGTLTSANPAADLYALIDTALTSAGYTFVDTVVISPRTHKVWKSPAASNFQNLDWYLDVAYTTTGTGSIWFSPFEDFNPTTDIGTRGPYNSTSATIETTYYSRYGATGSALETNWTTVSSNVNSLELSVASFGYWVSITPDRVLGLTTINATKIIYCGLFTPTADHVANAGASLFPLVATSLISSNSLTGGAGTLTMVTRMPKATSVSRWDFAASTYSYSTDVMTLEGGYGAIGDSTANRFTGLTVPRGRYIYVMFAMSSSSTFVSVNNTAPALVGTLRDVLVFSAATSVSRGDTVTIGGQTWVLGTKIATYAAVFAMKAS